MRVFLLDAQMITKEQLHILEKSLPPFRAALAKRCKRAEAFVACVLGFCLVRYAMKRMAPNIDAEHWCLNESGKPHLADTNAPQFNLSQRALDRRCNK